MALASKVLSRVDPDTLLIWLVECASSDLPESPTLVCSLDWEVGLEVVVVRIFR